jgi:hypothetical protein
MYRRSRNLGPRSGDTCRHNLQPALPLRLAIDRAGLYCDALVQARAKHGAVAHRGPGSGALSDSLFPLSSPSSPGSIGGGSAVDAVAAGLRAARRPPIGWWCSGCPRGQRAAGGCVGVGSSSASWPGPACCAEACHVPPRGTTRAAASTAAAASAFDVGALPAGRGAPAQFPGRRRGSGCAARL